MDHNCQSSVGREILQKRNPSLNTTSSPGSSVTYHCAREKSAGDSNKTTNTNTHRVEELETLISRLNNAMLTLQEENLKLHKRLRTSNTEMSAQITPDHSLDNSSRENETFSSENTDRNCSNSGLLQDIKYNQLKTENNHIKKTLIEAEKCSKQYARDLQKLLQKYEDLKAQNQILEQYNKQLVTDKSVLEKKLDDLVHKKIDLSQASLSSQTDALYADTGIDGQTEHCCRFSSESSITIDGAHHSHYSSERILTGVREEPKAVSEAVARLRKENQLLEEKLRQSSEKGAQAEKIAMRLSEEHAILQGCLQTVQWEKDLLQMEVRALHQDYINLTNSISHHLRDQVTGEHRPPEPCAPTPNHVPAFAVSESNSTELKESTFGSLGSTGCVAKKAPVIKRSKSSENITPRVKDRVHEGRKSTGSTPDKAPADHRRTKRGEMKLLTKKSSMQTVKHDQIDKDTIERIRIRYEEDEVMRAQRRVSQ
ncbi:hypothetical protein ACEWY4_007289 [Coilia grayii]|uniref:Uncharacterized protein n=1 Tax=Coilia grayii TaxID=363190 RepID=A0ABD1KG29_9TELE